MASPSDHAHLSVDYIEIPVIDLAAAKRFYGAAFGWTFNDYGDQYVGFRDGRAPDREAGGFRPEQRVEKGGPLIVLYSIELETTRDAVKTAGGELTKDIFSFPGGRRFHFTDPSGNELAVWSDR